MLDGFQTCYNGCLFILRLPFRDHARKRYLLTSKRRHFKWCWFIWRFALQFLLTASSVEHSHSMLTIFHLFVLFCFVCLLLLFVCLVFLFFCLVHQWCMHANDMIPNIVSVHSYTVECVIVCDIYHTSLACGSLMI